MLHHLPSQWSIRGGLSQDLSVAFAGAAAEVYPWQAPSGRGLPCTQAGSILDQTRQLTTAAPTAALAGSQAEVQCCRHSSAAGTRGGNEAIDCRTTH